MICEPGVRTFADHSRNTLDLSEIPAIRMLSHVTIIVDPSHEQEERTRYSASTGRFCCSGSRPDC